MNEIRRVLKVAAWRLLVLDLFRTLAVTATAGVGALILLLLAERIFGLAVAFPDQWLQAAAAAAGGAVLGALVWSAVRRARGVEVARELDERANLRESLSTAMCVASSEDPWAKMVVETARQKAVGVKVNQAIPYTAPRLWPVPLALGLSLAILWFSVPHVDLFGKRAQRQTAQKEQEAIKTVSNEVKKDDQKMQDLLQKAKVEVNDDKPDAGANEKPQTPDEIRRTAVKKLTNLTDKLSELKAADKAKQMEAMKQAMKQLKQPGPGPLENMTKSLQKGNFQQAQKDLEELSKQLASNQMSEENKAQAQQQLQKMAEQMEKLAKAGEEIQKKLEQAGMSKEEAKAAAKDPESLQKAMEQLKNLSPEQKKELMKQLAAQQAACKQCNSMSESMSKMAKGMGKQGMSQEGNEAMEGLSGQLSEMEMMASDMEALDAAMSECMSQLAKMGGQCNGQGNCDGDLMFKDTASPWKAGDSSKKGGGRGGPGQSGGSNKGDEQETGVNVAKRMSPTKQGQGPIVGQTFVQGDQVRGESVAEFQAAVESSAQAASEALETMQVPRELHPTVKSYFGRLEQKTKEKAAAPSPAKTPAK
jgi:hypothetical protein